MKVMWHGWTCEVVFNRYANGDRLAISLVGSEERTGDDPPFPGESVMRVTTNATEVELAPDEVLVKTWSENDGILEVMEEAGILQYTGRDVALGYAIASVCRVLVPVPAPEGT